MKLSIVTITRDDPGGVSRTLTSARSLRARQGVEQFVIDGSRDENALVVREEAIACGATYVWCEPTGIADAFNEGLARASGEWVWYLNGGDTVEETLDEYILLTLLTNSSADLAIFMVRMPEGPARMDRPAMIFAWPPVPNWIPHPATIVRRQTLVRMKGFSSDFRIAMDGDLWIRMIGGGAVADVIPLTIAHFAEGGVSGNAQAVASEVVKSMRQHRRLLIRRWLQQGHRIIVAWRDYRKLARTR